MISPAMPSMRHVSRVSALPNLCRQPRVEVGDFGTHLRDFGAHLGQAGSELVGRDVIALLDGRSESVRQRVGLCRCEVGCGQ